MNIDDYRYITTIADLGSFTRAAKELFIAQPSLSQRVKHIENTYGISIFIRDAKGVHLTSEGDCFVRYAKQILSCEEDLRREISDMHKLGQTTLMIGTSQFITSHLFDKMILQFHEQHPKVEFEFIENTSIILQQLLLAGKIDIAICYLPVTSPEIKYEVIFNDKFVLIPAKGSELEKKIQAQGFRPGDTIDVRLLEGAPMAMTSPGTKLHQCIMSIQEQHKIRLQIRRFGKNFTMLYSIAKAGIASTILYESFFDPEQPHEPFYYLEGVSNNDLSIAVAWRKGTYLQQPSKALISIAHRVARENAANTAAFMHTHSMISNT